MIPKSKPGVGEFPTSPLSPVGQTPRPAISNYQVLRSKNIECLQRSRVEVGLVAQWKLCVPGGATTSRGTAASVTCDPQAAHVPFLGAHFSFVDENLVVLAVYRCISCALHKRALLS